MTRGNDLLGYLGLALLAGAALVRLLFAGSGAAALGLAVLGLALFLVYFFRSGRDVQRFLSRRSTRAGSNVLGTTVFVLAIAVLVNILAGRIRVREDITADRIFTLSPETVQAIEAAPVPPVIWAFYPADDLRIGAVEALADAARLADPAVGYRAVDPDREPTLALEFHLREYATVVQVGERHETFVGAGEQDFLGALMRASRPGKRARVALLRGHGESSFNDSSPAGFRAAAEALHVRGYAVAATSLLEGRSLRDSVDVLVLAGPQVRFATGEEDSLRAFLAAGGRLLALLDPSWPATLDSVLVPRGFRFVPRLLSDPSAREPEVMLPAEYSLHPVVASLRRRNLPVVLRGAGEFLQERPTEPGTRQAVLIRSGSRVVFADEPAALPSSRVLAAAAEWPAEPRPGRLVVVGDSDFATGALFDVLGDGDLLLSAVQWLADEEAAIELRPRARASRPVLLTRQQGRALMVLLAGLLPAAVLGAGAVTWWRRR